MPPHLFPAAAWAPGLQSSPASLFPQVYTYYVDPCPSTVTPTAQSKPSVLSLISLKTSPCWCYRVCDIHGKTARKVSVLPAFCPSSRQGVFSNLGPSWSAWAYCFLGCVSLDKWSSLFSSIFFFVEWGLLCGLEK